MSAPAVVFADTTAVVIAVLDAALTVPVRGAVPEPRPDEFIRVQRTGGPRANAAADKATILVESWALTEPAAHDLAQLARAALHAAAWSVVGGLVVYRVDEFSGPGRLPDPVSGSPRFTQTFSVMVRGSAA